jgi:predicted MPP superfamily phosphohydrolase
LPFLTRRRFLQITAGTAAAGTLVFTKDASGEANRPVLVSIEIPLARLPAAFDGFTVAQLSDFHYDPHFSVVPITAAVEMVNRLNPDIVVLTGDFVTVPFIHHRLLHSAKRAAWAAEPCANLLAPLRSRLGTMSILGNHDMDSDVPRIMSALQSKGISVLRNRSIPLEQRGSRIWLCGMDSVMDHRQDINQCLSGIPSHELAILLIHEPDFADKAAMHSVDLQLSGHSHGGQIWLPGIGAPWLPRLARRYPRGLHRIGPLTLYTNAGLGTIRLPVRWNCPPEVTLFTLRSNRSKLTSKL